METIIQYVAGFLFTPEQDQVVLLNRQRPDWPVNLLDGVGGNLRPGELPRQAMSREFAQETSMQIPANEWRGLARLEGSNFQVYFFYAASAKAFELVNQGQPHLALYNITELPKLPLVSNLRWLIPLAMDKRVRLPIVFEDLPG